MGRCRGECGERLASGVVHHGTRRAVEGIAVVEDEDDADTALLERRDYTVRAAEVVLPRHALDLAPGEVVADEPQAGSGEAVETWIDVGAIVRVDADHVGERPPERRINPSARQSAHPSGPGRRREEQAEKRDPTHASLAYQPDRILEKSSEPRRL